MAMPAVVEVGREERLLVCAQRGDAVAYGCLIEPHRRELHVHCYRMLGSLQDAEDALQDALLRAWRALPRFEGRRLLRPWLYRIATNTCLDVIARRPRDVVSLEMVAASEGVAEPEPSAVVVEPCPDELIGLADGRATPEARYEQREAVELAFMAALQHLAPRQRAVLILRDVLGFSAREAADVLGATVAAVNSALQRARATMAQRLPQRSQQATLRVLGDHAVARLVSDFTSAWEAGDVAGLLAALTEDVTFTAPPAPARHGQDAIAAFLPVGPAGRWRLLPARAGAQLAFGAYRREPGGAIYRAAVLDVITLRDGRIAEVVAFARPEWFARFGLPDRLAG
jgi:RNA polymerase sigma-70 factor, ECF subfamily